MKNAFVWRLQSVRGIAALAVAGYHSLAAFYTPGATGRIFRAIMTVFDGPGAVFTFFILSGFVLGLSLTRKEHNLAGVWVFLWTRFLRLFPAMLGITLLYSGCEWVYATHFAYLHAPYFRLQPPGAVEIARNLAMLSASINSVTWSLQVEWLFSIIFPFTFLWSASRPWSNAVIMAVVLLDYHFLNSSALHLSPMAAPWSYLFMCYAGATLSGFVEPVAKFFKSVSTIIGYLLLVIAVGICGTISHFGNNYVLFTCAMTFIVAAVVSNSFPRLFKFLDFQPLISLGNISYSFYLLHPLALMIVATLMWLPSSGHWSQGHSLLAAAILCVFSVAGTVPLAKLSFEYLEKPFTRRTPRGLPSQVTTKPTPKPAKS